MQCLLKSVQYYKFEKKSCTAEMAKMASQKNLKHKSVNFCKTT